MLLSKQKKSGSCLRNPVLALCRIQQRETATDDSLKMPNAKERYRIRWDLSVKSRDGVIIKKEITDISSFAPKVAPRNLEKFEKPSAITKADEEDIPLACDNEIDD